jgi:TonB family protein
MGEPDPQKKAVAAGESMLASLRQDIALGRKEPAVLLEHIAVAAQSFTDATGAALGMRQGGRVRCVGSSGETAPALGAELSEDSGISGQCLRTGRNQRCDDTEADARVDVEVCRHLGVRSIAAVPVRARVETIGILEAFSSEPHAFTDEHMAVLASLAELADAVQGGKGGMSADAPAEGLFWQDSDSQAAMQDAGGRGRTVGRTLAIAGAVVVLGLLGAAGWRIRSEMKERPGMAAASVPVPARTVAPGATSAPDVAAPLQQKPLPGQLNGVRDQRASRKGPVTQAALIEPDSGMIRKIPTGDSSGRTLTVAPETQARTAEASVVEAAPPEVVVSSAQGAQDLAGGPVSMPRLAPPASTGAIPLELERKVTPVYPKQALFDRVEGTVNLEVTVNEAGRVEQARVVSGNPVLAQAAIGAVRRWRYRPALLNGKPVRSTTNVMLTFKLP